MGEIELLNKSIIRDLSVDELFGKGTFLLGKDEIVSDFKITCSTTEAYMTFFCPIFQFREIENAVFKGELEDGRKCNGILMGDFLAQNDFVIANCHELIIGELSDIVCIESVLLGIYFQHDFSFSHNGFHIAFTKSITPEEMAKRTKRIAGTVLEGNIVTISGEGLSIELVTQLLRDICFLLRPIVSSEVFYGVLKSTEGLIIYPKERMKGHLFGMQCNILESTRQYSDYLERGLKKFEAIESFDKMSIIDIGYSLSASAGCGLLETSLLVLTSSLERLGQKLIPDICGPESSSPINVNLKLLRKFLKDKLALFYEDYPNLFTFQQKAAIEKSISRIQCWDAQFIRKIRNHLSHNGWKIDLDFEKIKKLRDSLSHTGMMPSGFTIQEAYELQRQLEIFLFVHVLDLIGYEGRVASTENGWAAFPWKSELKAPRVAKDSTR